MKNETVIVLDFGGQYNQLIARRVRECNVYCEVLPYSTDIEKIKEKNPVGIIFTGGPNSVYAEKHLSAVRKFLRWAYRCSVSATAVSLWLICSAAVWRGQIKENTGKPRFL